MSVGLRCYAQVVPRYRSFFAVEIGLLHSITDEISHSGATFSSAVLRWVKQHPEEGQVRLLQGKDLTMLERCRKRLEGAWYLYHCSKLSCEALRGIQWRLTQENHEMCSCLVFKLHCQKEMYSFGVRANG